MLRRTIAAVATVITLTAPVALPEASAAPAARGGGDITGTWKGKVYNQDGPAGYTGTVRLKRSAGSYHATVRYSGGLNPTKWTYRGRDGAWFRFREAPRPGPASSATAAIKVRRSGPYLLVRWRVLMADYTGHMKARRHR